MTASERFSVFRRLLRPNRRSKRTILFCVFSAPAAVAAGFTALLYAVRAFDSLCADVKNACLRLTAAVFCAAISMWSAAACGSGITRDAAEKLREMLPSEQLTCAFSAGSMLSGIDRLAESLCAVPGSLLFSFAAAAGALAYMLRFSVGAAILAVLLAPIAPLVEIRYMRGSPPPQSDLWDQMTTLYEGTAFCRASEIVCTFDTANERLRTYAQRGIFLSSIHAPTAEFVRRAILSVAAVAAALSASLDTSDLGGFVCFLICADAYLRICRAVPGILQKYRRACAEAARIFGLPDMCEDNAAG